ncbi:uncharacterized protein with beta-barrel porin domain [Bradyrhizobium sp. USDA 4461]
MVPMKASCRTDLCSRSKGRPLLLLGGRAQVIRLKALIRICPPGGANHVSFAHHSIFESAAETLGTARNVLTCYALARRCSKGRRMNFGASMRVSYCPGRVVGRCVSRLGSTTLALALILTIALSASVCAQTAGGNGGKAATAGGAGGAYGVAGEAGGNVGPGDWGAGGGGGGGANAAGGNGGNGPSGNGGSGGVAGQVGVNNGAGGAGASQPSGGGGGGGGGGGADGSVASISTVYGADHSGGAGGVGGDAPATQSDILDSVTAGGGGGGAGGNGVTVTAAGATITLSSGHSLIGGAGGSGGGAFVDFGGSGGAGGGGGTGVAFQAGGALINNGTVAGSSGGAGGDAFGHYIDARSDNGAGGAGGIGVFFANTGSLNNLGILTGGNGGAAGLDQNNGRAGIGGNGGAGAVFAQGATATNRGTIAGGNGGTGGSSINEFGASGGTGGAAVSVMGNGELTNFGTVSGGQGGSGGYGVGNSGGSGGAGGAAIFVTGNGELTNSGTVAGGTGGTGGLGSSLNGGGGGAGGAAIFITGNGELTNSGTVAGGAGGAGEFGGLNGGNGGNGGAGASLALGGVVRNMPTATIAGGDGAAGNDGSLNGGAGGRGGTGASLGQAGAIANSGAITGGRGGDGGKASIGGNGGAGGLGASLGQTGAITNSGAITGGGGGNGGTGTFGGNGGAGGIGASLAQGGTLANTATAAIVGGNGGIGATGTNLGADGAGGDGITGANLTVINAGSISGGLGGDGMTRANAITFTGGSNVLELQAGSTITGNVVGTGTDTLRLGGSSNSSLDISSIGPSAQYQGFSNVEKTGTSTWRLTGTTNAAASWSIDQGTFQVDGTIANATSVNVNAGGTLSGTGVVGPVTTTIMSGGSFAPGNGTPGTSMTIAGNLVFQSGALYFVQVNPSTASFATITGAATLGGATVNAVFASGSYVAKQYTILTAGGGVSGTFGPTVVTTNLPTDFHTTLSSDANNAYLNLVLDFVPPGVSNFALPGGLNGNQQAVANALTSFFDVNGTIPLIYGALTPAGLTQISGEIGTSSQQTTFDAMNLFMGLLTDPFLQRNGRSGLTSPASSSAEDEELSAYAGRNRNEAFAMFTKAPPASFERRWSVWAAGFGGSQSTDGNALVGSNKSISSISGTAIGADYLFSPYTLAGFALAGGGTNFSVNGLGSGRSDLFQAGAYLRHTHGPAYISAALAYGWQDVTTDRIVTISAVDHLRAEFNANAWSGRIESGYRFLEPWSGAGLTPYAAAQFTTFNVPSYAEQVISGASAFALTYGARSPTDTRSELGFRTDKSFALRDGALTLRGRLAWAHDFDPDRSIAATFQALPGASFVVNGAAQASDSALTTASIEKKWTNGWSAAATFEGEFSNVTRSYASKAIVRCAW